MCPETREDSDIRSKEQRRGRFIASLREVGREVGRVGFRSIS